MSYFTNGVIYVIVPTGDITNEMINNAKESYYTTGATLRTSTDGLKSLFKIKQPISAVFNGYHWYNEAEVKQVLDDPEGEWVPSA